MKEREWRKLASIYIGTIIGAGFASGQEIIQFFGVFGYRGIYGVILTTFLFSIIGATVLSIVYKNKVTNYEEFLFPLFGKGLGRIIEIIITLFLFIGFCVMLAGSGAIFYQQFNISYNVGIYVMTICSLVTFLFSVKGISLVNSILVPFLLLGIVFVGSIVILKEGFVFSNLQGITISKTGNWVTSSLLYVGYNSISAVVIMTSLLSIIPNQKGAIRGGIFGGMGLGIMAIFILIPSLILYTDVYNLEIPMIKIAQHLGSWGKGSYSVILWCAMFTTAIANGFGCIRRISSKLNCNQKFISLIFCIITVPFAKFGFSSLVSIFYPLFGYIGVFIMAIIIISSLVHRIRSNI
ncbi:YkvI family membrane protein [Brassicibacter mesophilus]|uniref:YkvI family membrane protein n=1 Tax=Brassicibacter mesophilus TaxID=745119 RepID=UPI003D259998